MTVTDRPGATESGWAFLFFKLTEPLPDSEFSGSAEFAALAGAQVVHLLACAWRRSEEII